MFAELRHESQASLLQDSPSLVGLMSYYFDIPTSFSRGGYVGNKLLNKLSNKLW